jgi:hypothetical protein
MYAQAKSATAASTAPVIGTWSRPRLAARGTPPFQAKLTINQPGDKYEQEADRIAERIMRLPEPSLQCQPT